MVQNFARDEQNLLSNACLAEDVKENCKVFLICAKLIDALQDRAFTFVHNLPMQLHASRS